MSPADILTRVRQYASDDGAGEKWDDAQWMQVLNEALRWFYTYRPESRLTSAGAEAACDVVTQPRSSTDLTLADTYRVAVEDFMLARFYMSDAADSRDRSRAKLHQEAFAMAVGLKGG